MAKRHVRLCLFLAKNVFCLTLMRRMSNILLQFMFSDSFNIKINKQIPLAT